MKRTFFAFIIIIALLFTGCATITGPYVSPEEVHRLTEELKVKALEYRIEQLQRVANIQYRLLSSLPKEEWPESGPAGYLGIICLEINKYLKQLYNLKKNKGLVIVAVIKDSPAEKNGVKKGDILLSIDEIPLRTTSDLERLIRNLRPSQQLKLNILRREEFKSIRLKADKIARRIPVVMIDTQEVNAAAGKDVVFVTYGLMNFVRSDDDVAFVLAHELAHILRGHLPKMQLSKFLSMVVALGLGIVAESVSSGSGDEVMRSVAGIGDVFNARYSRDLEREADYFGLRYLYYAGYDIEKISTLLERFAIEIPQSMIENYFSTHPCSPERVLRIKKTVEEIKSKGIVSDFQIK